MEDKFQGMGFADLSRSGRKTPVISRRDGDFSTADVTDENLCRIPELGSCERDIIGLTT
jgi:hypothetical protein